MSGGVGRRYRAALTGTLRATAAAYGYTLTVATSISELTAVRGTPGVGELFLFAVGGLAGFALLEGILGRAPGEGESPPSAELPFAGALNLFSVAAALGAAAGLARIVDSSLSWAAASFAATTVYLLGVALQLTLVERWRR
ncbi:MAG: hypothetical protein ACR2K9_07940 [Solirubrobacteraceae bacterium]